MASVISNPQATQLSELREALHRWRSEGRPGNKIPPTIWARSLALASQVGVAVVAKRVGLDYGLLRSKANAADVSLPSRDDLASFVELFPSSTPPLPVCALEIEPTRGGRIRVENSGLDVRSLAALVRELAG